MSDVKDAAGGFLAQAAADEFMTAFVPNMNKQGYIALAVFPSSALAKRWEQAVRRAAELGGAMFIHSPTTSTFEFYGAAKLLIRVAEDREDADKLAGYAVQLIGVSSYGGYSKETRAKLLSLIRGEGSVRHLHWIEN